MDTREDGDTVRSKSPRALLKHFKKKNAVQNYSQKLEEHQRFVHFHSPAHAQVQIMASLLTLQTE